ncbi:energy transducer TonB [Komarekiella sp. 'clone 1']|uniref:Energy transducer TonB n=1 Tax=Komarekiella delphini-convector SJRDD-AB1 TaxID=2593771 RepID=A0AA40T0F4_9NOST|nr:energy transducer TonB [Komarekiella delphini-convector]MBD6618343.1 energy transducer TonB [Komarekiella delphini-convector SJRDD-AB1]
MSFSGITGEQRSKEVEALKSFLTYSLIGSLALHIGALSSGIGNFLARVPELEEEPIELAIVEPTTEPEKPVKEVPEEIKKQPTVTQPVQKVVESPKTPPVQQQPEKITPVPQKVQPINTPQKEVVTRSEAPVTSAPVTQPNDNLRQQLSGLRDSRPTPGGSDNPVPANTLSNSGSGVALNTGTGRGIGTGTGIGRGIGTGNQSGNRSPVVTAPTAPTPPKINNSGTGNGRAACRECAAKYPEAARRRGIEGRVEVAVDTDEKGNVTNVRVAKSSGNRDLDEETLRQARNWKLKPASGGRQGVSIATEYAIQGSRRHRQAQEQKKRREAQQRNQQTATSNTDTNTTRRRRRSLTPTIVDVPPERPVQSRVTPQIRRPRVENNAAGSTSEPRTTRTQGTARESLRSIRRERVSNPSPKPQATPNRRRRRENTNTSQSQNKLRQSLRQLRQQPQSQPPAGTNQE